MPAKSQSQRGLIFARRDQYGSKKNTPKKWKWIWDEDWENKGKLPKKVKKKKNESVNEAYEVPLEAYINDLFSYMIAQGLDENEIDAALNDPDNMDIVELGATDGLSVEETYSRLDLYNPVAGWHNSNRGVNMSEKFVPESVNEFVDPEDEFIDVDDEEGSDIINTWGPYDTPVGETPTEITPINPRKYDRKFKKEERLQNREAQLERFKKWLKKKRFVNESASLEDQFAESVYDELMERGFTYEEADFAVEQASDIIGELAYEAPHSPGATRQAADWIEENIFGK